MCAFSTPQRPAIGAPSGAGEIGTSDSKSESSSALRAKLKNAQHLTVTAQRMQRAARRAPQRGAMPGAAINSSYETTAALGTPADANWLERLRDGILGFFVRFSTFFDLLALCAICALVISIGVLAVVLLPAMFEVGEIGSWTELRNACNETYLETIGNVTQRRDGMRPPRGYFYGSTREEWSAPECNTAQQVFTLCVKACTAIFSYINFLPIPWRVSIWMDAFVGRPMMDDELKDGVDFYGRPTDALWFHLPRADRRRIAVLLNLAWVTHYVSQAYHLAYWTTAAGQELAGSLGQNVPFILSILSGVVAGVLQGIAEKRTMTADPERFPPKAMEWVKAAVHDTNERFQQEKRKKGCCCRLLDRRYWQLMREEMAEEKAKADAKAGGGETTPGGKKGPSALAKALNGGIVTEAERSCKKPVKQATWGRGSMMGNGKSYADHGHLTGESLPFASTVACGAMQVGQAVMETVCGRQSISTSSAPSASQAALQA